MTTLNDDVILETGYKFLLDYAHEARQLASYRYSLDNLTGMGKEEIGLIPERRFELLNRANACMDAVWRRIEILNSQGFR